eukprot:TRINITY_DN324_c0_g1_i2.p1 TRINITY_DN324_c0_g1~~TRINITY_DN324_c0_g1_i2.p1  ORF type:complete len:443 (-),score=119.12 TRINITY_DN324_c0_g1_i2:205-1533(-)
MGGGFSKKKKKAFEAIEDKYETIEEVQDALKEAGLHSSNLILGLDYTESNHYTGINTFDGRCLHDISPDRLNPYQSVITIVGRTLEPFDDDKLIPCYGFGDSTTKDKGVFKFYDDRDCYRFTEVLQRYNEVTPTLTLSGPTNFAPLIHQAVEIVKKEKTYHILVIIADGQVVNKKETTQAILAACEHPLSIIMVGVGDGPWDMMKEFDDGLPKRKFDNVRISALLLPLPLSLSLFPLLSLTHTHTFSLPSPLHQFQFVNYHEVTANAKFPEPAFAIAALQEIPDQYKEIRKLNLVQEEPEEVPGKPGRRNTVRKESLSEELARRTTEHFGRDDIVEEDVHPYDPSKDDVKKKTEAGEGAQGESAAPANKETEHAGDQAPAAAPAPAAAAAQGEIAATENTPEGAAGNEGNNNSNSNTGTDATQGNGDAKSPATNKGTAVPSS